MTLETDIKRLKEISHKLQTGLLIVTPAMQVFQDGTVDRILNALQVYREVVLLASDPDGYYEARPHKMGEIVSMAKEIMKETE
jgi:hypothetical protein